MAKGTFNEVKAKPWKGKDLKGPWLITRKLDGARMLRDAEGNPVSRAGKPLYNLDHIPATIKDAEIYAGNWEDSMSLVRSSVNGSPVPLECVYSIDPPDPRLVITLLNNPTVEQLTALMDTEVSKGNEGLIIRNGDTWFKVKPDDTADVLVTGFQWGTGKHKGKMGALLTAYGKVGTGFSDEERSWWAMMYELHGDLWLHKQLIEVGFMEWTSGGKFRHPRYLRIRDDKTEESV